MNPSKRKLVVHPRTELGEFFLRRGKRFGVGLRRSNRLILVTWFTSKSPAFKNRRPGCPKIPSQTPGHPGEPCYIHVVVVIASDSLLLRTIFEGAEMEGALMRKLLFLICVLGIPCAARAQSKSTTWENLITLQAGEKIHVVEMNSKKVSGRFSNVSDAAISLQAEASEQTIQRRDVRSVKLMKHQHRLRNTLIGAAVGFGAGTGIGAAAAHPCSPSQPYCLAPGRGIPAAFGGVIGLIGGAVVGALVPSHRTIYLVKPQ
jgi:hypothetical protein